MQFPVTYVINLARSPARLAAIAGMLDRLGLPWARVDAIDGAPWGPLPWAGFDDVSYRFLWGKVPHPNEFGCYLSHLRALEAYLGTDASHAIIAEDDAVFADDLPDVVAQLIRRPAEWDVVKLETRHWGMPVTVGPLPNGHRLVAYTQRNTGAAAYLVNRRAAAAYVRKLLPMRVPYDHAFDQVWRFGLRMRGVLPPLAHCREIASDIGYAGKAGSKRWAFRRTTAPLHRALIELSRIAHYLIRDPVWSQWLLNRLAVPSGADLPAKGAADPPSP